MAERSSGIREAGDFERAARAVLAVELLSASGPTARRGVMSGAVSPTAARGSASVMTATSFAWGKERGEQGRMMNCTLRFSGHGGFTYGIYFASRAGGGLSFWHVK